MVHPRNFDTTPTTPKDSMRTPPSLFKRLDDRFHFNKDIACDSHNHLCPVWYDDFLHSTVSLYHGDVAFCNPPYSRGMIEKFLAKAYSESLKGAIVVLLLPGDISTQWFHKYCFKAAEWIIIDGRVKFNDIDGNPSKGSPQFGSICIVFDETRRKANGHLIVRSMDWKEGDIKTTTLI
jgi:phage N-6-adenine-methyltransferase